MNWSTLVFPTIKYGQLYKGDITFFLIFLLGFSVSISLVSKTILAVLIVELIIWRRQFPPQLPRSFKLRVLLMYTLSKLF